MQRSPLIAGGIALAAALALLPWGSGDDRPGDPRSGGPSPLQAGLPVATPAFVGTGPLAPAAQPAPWALAQRAGARSVTALVTAAAPPTLLVGESGELVIGLGAHDAVAEIRFTVSFDANVLQVRAAGEGDWAAGGGEPRFTAAIADAEDQVRIHRAVAGRPRAAGASIAVVQFQAVAPGTTSIVISDLVVQDPAGQVLPSRIVSANLQLTAESLPAARPALAREAVAVAAPAADPIDNDD